jgi:hypothetical protein
MQFPQDDCDLTVVMVHLTRNINTLTITPVIMSRVGELDLGRIYYKNPYYQDIVFFLSLFIDIIFYNILCSSRLQIKTLPSAQHFNGQPTDLLTTS